MKNMLKYSITSLYLVLYTDDGSSSFFFQVKFILLEDDFLHAAVVRRSKKRESNLLLRDNRRWEIGGRLINWRRAITVIYRVAEEERARMRKGGRAT